MAKVAAAKIASSPKVRRRLHAIPVALGLIALLIAIMVDHRATNSDAPMAKPQTQTKIESLSVTATAE